MVFNSSFRVALLCLRDEFISVGIALRLHAGCPDFWREKCNGTDSGQDDDDASDVHGIEVAFVDDECVMLHARSAKMLDEAIDLAVSCLTHIF